MASIRTIVKSKVEDRIGSLETKTASVESIDVPCSAPITIKAQRRHLESGENRLKNDVWFEFEDLDVHVGFVLLGLLVVKLKTIENDKIKLVTPEQNTFVLGSRKLSFFQPRVKLNKKLEAKEKESLGLISVSSDLIPDHASMGLDDREHVLVLNKLNYLESQNHRAKQVLNTVKDAFDLPYPSLNLIIQYCDFDFIVDKSDEQKQSIRLQQSENQIVHNAERRSEIFYPVVLNLDGKPGESQRAYVYPWLSKDLKKAGKESKFEGCKRFISCECMFATNLKGIDERDQSFPLIKHDIILEENQSIEEIAYEETFPNIYEKQRFDNEFKKELELISKYSKWDSRPQLAKHLPVCDYILFGTQLYIRGKITLKALNELFKEILKKGKEITSKMATRCRERNIEITMGSPFENLFKPILEDIESELLNGESGQLAHIILGELGVPLPSEYQHVLQPAMNEQEFVQRWLAKVQRGGDQQHCEVWRDVLQVPIKTNSAASQNDIGQFKDTITDIDTLFKVGNGVWTLINSKGTKDFETMIMVPLTEKPIQLMAEKLCKYPQLAKKYPATINLTILDSLITHHARNKGLSFYQYRHPFQHLALFNKWQQIAPMVESGELTRPKQIAEAFAESVHSGSPGNRSAAR